MTAQRRRHIATELDRLNDAINQLVGQRSTVIANHLHTRPSRLHDLRHATLPSRTPGNLSNRAPSSTPAARLDAVDVHTTIRTTLHDWSCEGTSIEDQLNYLTRYPWTPDDADHLARTTTEIQRWTRTIDDLIDPPRRLTLAAPCPACGVSTVYRNDNGINVRIPALTVSIHECTCLACGTHWDSTRFELLAQAIA